MRSRMIDRLPPPGLRSGIRRCTGYEEVSDGLISRREVAQDGVTLIFNLGPPMRVGGPDEPMCERTSFVAPMNGTFGVTEAEGLSRGIQIDLEPAFAHRLLAVPMHELETVVVALEEILGRRYLELIERLADAPGWGDRFEVLEAGLQELCRRGPEPTPDVEFAWRSLQRCDGRIPVGRLAAEIGCSRRHLGNRFREQIGLPPKQAARLIRFNRAVERLGEDHDAGFAEIAADAGYFDQPHMNREFLEFAGTTPGRFLSSALPDAPGFAIDPQFPSVQDPAAAAA